MSELLDNPTKPSPDLPPDVRAFVADFRARQRRADLLRATGWAAAFGSVWLMAACVADRLAPLDRATRFAWLTSNLLSLAAIVLPAVLARRRRGIDWLEAARQIEKRSGRLGEGLLTLVSQHLGDPRHRGSEGLLGELQKSVAGDLQKVRARSLVGNRQMLAAWILAAAAMLILLGSLAVPQLAMPRLLARATMPWRDLAPVTGIELRVQTGNARVIQGSPVTIVAHAARLDGAAVDDIPVLRLAKTGENSWDSIPMIRAADAKDRFQSTLESVGHDFRYFVQDGQAWSDVFGVQVIARPAVVGFSAVYQYPAYTGLDRASMECPGGVFQAPAGTRATIVARFDQPIASATLWVGSRKIEMNAGQDPRSRTCELAIDANSAPRMRMIATSGIDGCGPDSMAIRCLADQPPIVQFPQPAQDLRLTATSRLEITGLASDDWGVVAIELHASRNGGPPTPALLPLSGTMRQRRGQITLDLAKLGLRDGDVLRLVLAARDTSGQTGLSPERVILIGQQATDLDGAARLENLRRSLLWSDRLAQDADAAGQTLADSSSGDQARAAASQQLADAQAASEMMSRSILGAIAKSGSPQDSTALSCWLDESEKLRGAIRRARQWTGDQRAAALPAQLADVAAQTRQLQHDLQVFAGGDLSRQLMDLRAQQSAAAPGSTLGKSLKRDIAAGAARLGADPTAKDFDARLASTAAAARDLAQKQTAVDFAKASQGWAKSLDARGHSSSDLDARLASAAQAESLRPDADLQRAADLDLASRAASALAAHPESDAKERFGQTMAKLQQDNPAARAQARTELAQLSRQNPATDASSRQRSNAIQANAKMARDDYSESPDNPDLAGAMAQARQIDRLQKRQQRLARQGDSSDRRGQSSQQSALAKAIAKQRQSQDSPNSAADSLSQLDSAQKSLSKLSQQIAQAQSSHSMDAAAAQEASQALSQATAKSEAASAASAVGGSMQRLTQASQRGDAKVIDAAAADAQGQIAKAQSQLSAAKAAAAQADPLGAAQWFAQGAAAALADGQTDPAAAAALQQSASDALSRARNQANHAAAVARLSQIPAFAGILSGTDAPALAADGPRQWGHMQARVDSDQTPTPHDAGPAGYQEPIKAYFDALDRVAE